MLIGEVDTSLLGAETSLGWGAGGSSNDEGRSMLLAIQSRVLSECNRNMADLQHSWIASRVNQTCVYHV